MGVAAGDAGGIVATALVVVVVSLVGVAAAAELAPDQPGVDEVLEPTSSMATPTDPDTHLLQFVNASGLWLRRLSSLILSCSRHDNRYRVLFTTVSCQCPQDTSGAINNH